MRENERRFSFTKGNLGAVDPPAKGRIYIYDVRERHLALCVTAAGAKTFYCCRKVNGRPVRYRLGRYPDISIEVARKATVKFNAEVATGGNPQATKQAARRTTSSRWTVGELWDHYLEHRAKVHFREKTVREETRIFTKHLAKWKRRDIESITTAEVASMFGKVGRKHPYMSNRLRELIRKLFNYARRVLKRHIVNPVDGTDAFPEQSRTRYVTADELKAFFETVEAEPPALRDFFKLLIYTGARRGNVQSMAWTNIDLKRGVWTIPHDQSKNREPVDVVLVEPVLDILRRRRRNMQDLWVFPGRATSGHIEEPKKAWSRVRERAGLHDVTMHDLRRTLGSWQTISGSSLSIVGKSLGQKSIAATRVYARLSLDPVRESVEKAVKAMQAAAS